MDIGPCHLIQFYFFLFNDCIIFNIVGVQSLFSHSPIDSYLFIGAYFQHRHCINKCACTKSLLQDRFLGVRLLELKIVIFLLSVASYVCKNGLISKQIIEFMRVYFSSYLFQKVLIYFFEKQILLLKWIKAIFIDTLYYKPLINTEIDYLICMLIIPSSVNCLFPFFAHFSYCPSQLFMDNF